MKKTLVALVLGIMFALFAIQYGDAAEDGDVFEDTAAAAEAALTAAAEAAAAAEKAALTAAGEAAAAAEKAAAAAAEAVEAAKKAAAAAEAVEAAKKAAIAEVPAETSPAAETSETSPAAETPSLLADIHQAAGLTCSDCHAESPPASAVNGDNCLTCHGDYQELTAGYYANPHNAHYVFSDCGDCHHAHEESTNQCLGCHAF